MYDAQIIVSFATCIALAVLYGDLYSAGIPSFENHVAMGIFVFMILLPLYATFLFLRRSSSKKRYPVSSARVAVAQWEAEMNKYRCQVRAFAASSTHCSDDEERKRRIQADAHFKERARKIWESVQPMMLKRPLPTILPSLHLYDSFEATVSRDKEVITETTPMLATSHRDTRNKAETNDSNLWTLADYIELRLNPVIKEKTQIVKALRLWRALGQGFVLMGMVGVSVTVVIGQPWLIPFILAVVAAAGIGLESSLLTTQLEAQMEAVERLAEILNVWESRMNEDEESAMGTAGRWEDLVEQVEAVLMKAAG